MKFECKKCGECCKKFGVGGYLPLWEWEARKLKEIAKKKNLSLNIQPIDMIYDKKSSFALFAQYALVQEPCPFLIDNKCSIYENRPLVCRSFPLYETPLLKEGNIDLSFFIKCPNFNTKKFMLNIGCAENGTLTKFNKGDFIKKYKGTFGEDIFASAFQIDIIRKYLDKMMKYLIQNKKIKLRKVNKLDYHKYNYFVYPQKSYMCLSAH